MSNYAIITKQSYDSDPVAQQISQSPRCFMCQGVQLVILSIEPAQLPSLIEYAEQVANGVEFELTVGNGKVTLLTHSQIIKLLYDLD